MLYHNVPSAGSSVGAFNDAVYDNLLKFEKTIVAGKAVESSVAPAGTSYKLSSSVELFAV